MGIWGLINDMKCSRVLVSVSCEGRELILLLGMLLLLPVLVLVLLLLLLLMLSLMLLIAHLFARCAI